MAGCAAGTALHAAMGCRPVRLGWGLGAFVLGSLLYVTALAVDHSQPAGVDPDELKL